jgi:hypothetical protein
MRRRARAWRHRAGSRPAPASHNSRRCRFQRFRGRHSVLTPPRAARRPRRAMIRCALIRHARKAETASWRDVLGIALPSLLLAAGAFWLAAQFIKPAPPGHLIISTGGEGGAYQRFAARYKRRAWPAMASRWSRSPPPGRRKTLRACATPTSKSMRPSSRAAPAHRSRTTALVSRSATSITSRCGCSTARGSLRGADKVLELKGKRVAVGGEGSGTHNLAMAMLAANGLDAKRTRACSRPAAWVGPGALRKRRDRCRVRRRSDAVVAGLVAALHAEACG